MPIDDRDYMRDVPEYRRLAGRERARTRPWAWVLLGGIVLLFLYSLAHGGAAGTPVPPLPVGSIAVGVSADPVVTQPTGNTPVALQAAAIASWIAGRPVAVRCESSVSWTSLGRPGELGFVHALYDSSTSRVLADSTLIELSPQACSWLQDFATAVPKPTQCRPPAEVEAVPCFIGEPIGRSADVPAVCGESGCFSAAAAETSAYWQAYDQSAEALWAVAHEAVHIWQNRVGATVPPAGVVEAQAECSGLQYLPEVAVEFGDTTADARAVTSMAWKLDYPKTAQFTSAYARSHPYWSSECRPGGALDIHTPGSTTWP